jgi:hypothetical protein
MSFGAPVYLYNHSPVARVFPSPYQVHYSPNPYKYFEVFARNIQTSLTPETQPATTGNGNMWDLSLEYKERLKQFGVRFLRLA